MNAWEPVRTGDGSWTLRHPVHGQTCHSAAGAWEEACLRYAAPVQLAARVRAGARELDLLDVGTGLGWNLAAALRDVEEAGGRLAATSLELTPDVCRAALALPSEAEAEWEPWWGQVRTGLRRALAAPGQWVELGAVSRLQLLLGDGGTTLPAADPELRFDAVFQDPFSPEVESALWQPAFLAELARRMRPGAWLSTYTTSLRVRRHMLAAGLRVGAGPRVGTKSSGTLASPDLDPPSLAARTLRKLGRGIAADRIRSGGECEKHSTDAREEPRVGN